MFKKIKILMVVLFLVLACGCENNLMNTPTKRVETLLNNYITVNDDVLKDLDNIVNMETTMSDAQKESYKDIMKKLYQNLSYEIKDETIDGDVATVEVEIEVYNYQKGIDDANEYYKNNQTEFLKEDNSIDMLKFNDYKIGILKNVNEKVKYTLDLTLSKIDNKWVLDDLTDTQISKIHGMYN